MQSQNKITDTCGAAIMAAAHLSVSVDRPRLVSVPEARRQLGGIGATCFYSLVKRHGIKLVRLGGRSLVPSAEIDRVIADLIATGAPDASETARALAAKSVAVRQRRRGSSKQSL